MNKQLAYLLGRISKSNGSFTLLKTQKRLLHAFNANKDAFNTFTVETSGKKLQISYELKYHELFLSGVIEYFPMEYIRGMYESTDNKGRLDVVNVACNKDTSDTIQKLTATTGTFNSEKEVLVFTKHNALDFLSQIYQNGEPSEYSKFCFSKYTWLANALAPSSPGVLEFEYTKTKDAVAPFKGRASDSGYDLTLIGLKKQVGNTYWYHTGITVEPPNGFYFDLVPRSSIVKLGYTLANNVGIVDRSYTGEVIVVLNKFNSDAPDLEFPVRAVQIIPRRVVHMIPKCVEALSETNRGDGGFGSSN